MKTIPLFFAIIAFAALSVTGCKSQEETSSTQPVQKKATKGGESISNDSKPAPQAETCRLVVSFISIGEGPDFQAKDKVENFVSKWNDEKKQNVFYEAKAWGREGEVDFCFKLNELTEKEQLVFIDGAKASVSESELVRFKENANSYYDR